MKNCRIFIVSLMIAVLFVFNGCEIVSVNSNTPSETSAQILDSTDDTENSNTPSETSAQILESADDTETELSYVPDVPEQMSAYENTDEISYQSEDEEPSFCPICSGEGFVICTICNGSGTFTLGPSERKCSQCSGTGHAKCKDCLGTGQYSVFKSKVLADYPVERFTDPNYSKVEVDCAYCHGTGKIKCTICDETGYIGFEYPHAGYITNPRRKCKTCGGTKLRKCTRCAGSGKE